MFLSRREFLKSASTVAGVAAIGVDMSTIAAAATQAKQTAGVAQGTQYVKSTCVHCVNFCGIEVKLENGVIRNVYPDKPRAPYYNVGICPKGVASGFNTYSGVPASMVGRTQEIEIGPMSGLSNVKYWLRKRGIDPDDQAVCDRIFAAAKSTDHSLTEEELAVFDILTRPGPELAPQEIEELKKELHRM